MRIHGAFCAIWLGTLALPAAAEDAPGWSGAYGGLSGSYGFGDSATNLNFVRDGLIFPEAQELPSTFNASRNGFLGGGELGYDRRIDRLTLGFQLDLSGGDLRAGDHSSGFDLTGAPQRSFAATETSVLSTLGTLRGQAGFLVEEDLKLYGFAGLATGRVDDESGLDFSGAGGAHYHGLRAETLAGWTAGAGAEYALGANWALKLEYLHYDLGHASAVGFPIRASDFHTQSDLGVDGDLVRLAIDYHFGAAAEPDDDAGAFQPALDVLGTLRYQFGLRDFYSTGTSHTRLGASGVDGLVSRLTYSDLDADAGEIFGRADHPSGAFAKFFLGLGAAGSGTLTDEDFPPVTDPASRTLSNQRNGALSYAAVDLGFTVLDQPIFDGSRLSLAPFVGYGYYHEQLNAYGCTQTIGNTGICPPGTVSPGALSITDNAEWNMLRLGVGGTWTTPWHGLAISLEGAWLPYGWLDAADNHWLRIDTPGLDGLAGPIRELGRAHGMQLEAMATMPVTDALDIGIGARYWYFSSPGSSLFTTEGDGSSLQDTDFSTRRFGGFAQASLHF